MADPPRLLISAGESSGDHHAARVLHALQARGVNPHVAGMGGPRLAAAGMEILVDCREMAIVGLVEVLRHWRRIQHNLALLREHLRNERPDLLILVDYPDFNLKLAETARELDIPVLYYISPQVWAWRPRRIHRIGRLVDRMAVLFPFEEALYAREGIPVRHVGHPLVDEIGASVSAEAARTEFGVVEGQTVVGLLPGSRNGEVQRLLPLLAESARVLRQSDPEIRFLLPVAETLDPAALRATVEACNAPIEVIEGGRVHDVVQICDSVIAASGTVTLEVALLRVPMTVVYRVHWLTYLILRQLVTIEHISLVNIVAQGPVVKELIQGAAHPQAVANETLRLLHDPTYRARVMTGLDTVRAALGEGDAPDRTAALIEEMLEEAPSSGAGEVGAG